MLGDDVDVVVVIVEAGWRMVSVISFSAGS